MNSNGKSPFLRISLRIGLPILEIGLIVAMKRLKEKGLFFYNFEDVYREYSLFLQYRLPQYQISRMQCLQVIFDDKLLFL